MQEANWEIASHGLKMGPLAQGHGPRRRSVSKIAEAIRLHTYFATGERPYGLVHWPLPRPGTVDLVSEEGGFEYVSDTYDDDLPYWRPAQGAAPSSSSPTRSPPTTCASSPRPASTMARNTPPVLEGRASTSSTRKAAVGSPKINVASASTTASSACPAASPALVALPRLRGGPKTKSGSSRRIDTPRHWCSSTTPTKPPGLVPLGSWTAPRIRRPFR